MTVLLLLLACSEYTVREEDPPPPADPPGDETDAQGEPPSDWASCASGHYGLYFNLPATHPDVEPLEPDAPDPEALDWWSSSYLAFHRYDPSIDFGSNWWPVDDGLERDPAYFAVQWTSWIRVQSAGTFTFLVGAADDVWVEIDGEPLVALSQSEFDPTTYAIDLRPGQYPVKIRYAQRTSGTGGFRFRLVSGDATICYPEFPDG